MATRVGADAPFIPPAGVTSDNRLDQQREQLLKQLQEHELVHTRDEAERVVDHVVRQLVGAAPSSARPPSPRVGDGAPPRDLHKLVADFQRQNGLPGTGRLDSATVTTMKDAGVLTPPASRPAPATPTTPTTPATQVAAATPGTSSTSTSSPRAPVRAEDTAAARQARSAADQQVRARVDGGSRKDLPARSTPNRDANRVSDNAHGATRDAAKAGERADRVADPARLLASLVAGGFTGKKGSVEDGVKGFQATFGLPVTGKIDAATAEALASHGHVESDAPKKTQSDKPIEPKQQVRRALNDAAPTTKTVADKDVVRDSLRPQAPTQRPTTSSEVAARAQVSPVADAKEQARVDSVVAQQAAVERGKSEGTGDPAAIAGTGEIEGKGAGKSGAGGASGGGDMTANASSTSSAGRPSADVNGAEGDETAVGNAKAGDDVFDDDERGQANVKSNDAADADGDGPGHWQVPLLSEQLRAALEKIVRDDDGSGPVTYTWDVTFHRPGVYAAGQPAEEIWHVAVNHATAFDGVWQKAADAIASRMLYAEPEGQAPTLEDFIMALRRARVRDPH